MALRRAATVLIAALVAAAAISVPAQAATVTQTIDGITYQVDDANVAAGAYAIGGTSVPTDLVIPSSVDIGGTTYVVVGVGGNAFDYMGLTSVVLPNTLKYLDPYSFAHNSLTSVAVPGSVSTINTAAFAYNNISSVTLNEGTRIIAGGAFNTNNLSNVVIPSTVYDISGQVFDLNPSLASVTFQGNAPTLNYTRPLGPATTVVRYYEGSTGFTTPTWTGGSATTYTTEMIPLATVAFDANGHGTAPASTTARPGTTVADPGALTAAGHTFTGWWTSATGGTQVTFPYSRTSDVTLYAQWERMPATISAPATAEPGAAITVSGAGFGTNETLQIWLNSTPVRLATITADADGAFSTSVTIPADAAAGAHTLEVRGTTTATVTRAITISAVLAATGPEVSRALWAAVALVIAGSALVVSRRRA